MGNKFISIDIKNRTYYCFDDMFKVEKLIKIKLRSIKSHIKIFDILYWIFDG